MSKRRRKGWVTAEELMAELESDPEWVRRRDERARRHAAYAAKVQAEVEPEAAPLRADLAACGFVVNSVWDLVNSRTSYAAAVPVLRKHLRLARHPVLREGIARALTVREARGVAGSDVLAELKRDDSSDDNVRWALANALTVVADGGMVGEIQSLLEDARYKDVHERLEAALKRAVSS